MNDVIKMQIGQFSLIYLLLLVVLAIMKKCRINQTKLMIIASIRMTAQLALAGFVLTYIFENPHPAFTIAYLIAMCAFAISRVLAKNRTLNRRFQIIIAASIALSGISVIVFFIGIVVGESLFNPRYVIPIAGMLMGNTMTGATLGVKAFRERLAGQRARIEALLNVGATPRENPASLCASGAGNGASADLQRDGRHGDRIPSGHDDRPDSIRHASCHSDFVPDSNYDCHLHGGVPVLFRRTVFWVSNPV